MLDGQSIFNYSDCRNRSKNIKEEKLKKFKKGENMNTEIELV